MVDFFLCFQFAIDVEIYDVIRDKASQPMFASPNQNNNSGRGQTWTDKISIAKYKSRVPRRLAYGVKPQPLSMRTSLAHLGTPKNSVEQDCLR